MNDKELAIAVAKKLGDKWVRVNGDNLYSYSDKATISFEKYLQQAMTRILCMKEMRAKLYYQVIYDCPKTEDIDAWFADWFIDSATPQKICEVFLEIKKGEER